MNFVRPLFACLLLCTTSAVLSAQETSAVQSNHAESESTVTGQLRHVVLFKFKQSASPESIKQVEAAFRELPSKIEQIVGFEWGTNNSTEDLAKGYTHCFLVTFADEAGRAAYLPHPAHKEFVQILKPHLEEAFVLDYVAKK